MELQTANFGAQELVDEETGLSVSQERALGQRTAEAYGCMGVWPDWYLVWSGTGTRKDCTMKSCRRPGIAIAGTQ
jgi:hypothetical protein